MAAAEATSLKLASRHLDRVKFVTLELIRAAAEYLTDDFAGVDEEIDELPSTQIVLQ